MVWEPNVATVMRTRVVTARPDTPFKELVTTMADHAISAVPVVDDHAHPIGVVSEADVLAKQEFHGGADNLPRGDRAGRDRWYRSLGLTAAEVMTTPVATIGAGEPVSAAARILTEKKVRRLFVVDNNGALIGLVARRDLLRVFLRTDADLRADIERKIVAGHLGVPPAAITVRVSDGMATLDGRLDRRSTVDTVCRFVRALPGVVGVHNNLHYANHD